MILLRHHSEQHSSVKYYLINILFISFSVIVLDSIFHINMGLVTIFILITICKTFYEDLQFYAYCYYPITLQIVALFPYILLLLYGGIEISLSKAVQCGAGDDHSIRPTPKYILDNGLGNPFTKESQVMGTMPK